MKPKRKPRKQSSAKASRIAGRWMSVYGEWPEDRIIVSVADLLTVCASVLSQDESPRSAPARKGRKR